jgi:hypothetical protein
VGLLRNIFTVLCDIISISKHNYVKRNVEVYKIQNMLIRISSSLAYLFSKYEL